MELRDLMDKYKNIQDELRKERRENEMSWKDAQNLQDQINDKQRALEDKKKALDNMSDTQKKLT